jgi:3',5'-cyclic AMP phosphodiesterase CpdA
MSVDTDDNRDRRNMSNPICASWRAVPMLCGLIVVAHFTMSSASISAPPAPPDKEQHRSNGAAARRRSWQQRRLMINSTAAAGRGKADALFRFALISDSHHWPASSERQAFVSKSDAQPIRDGLVVGRSPETWAAALTTLQKFAANGGAFAIHAGDPACGGASFHASSREFEAQLRAVAAAERAALPRGWPIYHVPGNHDLEPNVGGLAPWLAILGGGGEGGDGHEPAAATGVPHPAGPTHAHRALRRDGWRIILLDTASAVGIDTDGHGHVGAHQLRWLERQLDEAAAEGDHVILVAHQLLVPPTDRMGQRCAWFVPQYDLVDNAEDVLSLMDRHSHVRLVLHAHVHANSLTMRRGVPFVTSASASEYPMTWREVIVRRCGELELRSHQLAVSKETLDASAQRDTRGFNEAKRDCSSAEPRILLHPPASAVASTKACAGAAAPATPGAGQAVAEL